MTEIWYSNLVIKSIGAHGRGLGDLTPPPHDEVIPMKWDMCTYVDAVTELFL
jgi:hypothetical protein